ncbi:MAG: hypothetical protein MI806_17000 [Minwuiales bacterium]|nr:hypothetical protein [Minwuiales bacterium]
MLFAGLRQAIDKREDLFLRAAVEVGPGKAVPIEIVLLHRPGGDLSFRQPPYRGDPTVSILLGYEQHPPVDHLNLFT